MYQERTNEKEEVDRLNTESVYFRNAKMNVPIKLTESVEITKGLKKQGDNHSPTLFTKPIEQKICYNRCCLQQI